MAQHTLRILHFSDLHERGPREQEAWRRRAVLGEEWLKNLEAVVRHSGPDGLDLVACTGDIADFGRSEEYGPAGEFFDTTLAAVGVPRERFFVVPGNHDVERAVEPEAWQAMRAAAATVDSLELSRWMAGGPPPRALDPSLRERILQRTLAFYDFACERMGAPGLQPARSPHGRLGYRVTLKLPGRPFAVHVIGLDSAWLAGDEHDARKLRVTEDQVARLVTDGQGRPLDGFRLALIHHPLEELAAEDQAAARRLLAKHVDLLLRGHLHDEELADHVEPGAALRQLAAGCLYEGHRANRWPSACHLIEALVDDRGRPLEYRLRLRSWSPRGSFWHDDASLYREAPGGHLVWRVAPSPAADPPPALGPTRPPETPADATMDDAPAVPVVNPFQKAAALGPDNTTYIRRPADSELEAALGQEPLIVIHGDYGIGKSSLLMRARRRLGHERDVFHVDLQSVPTYDAERFHVRFFALLGRTFAGVSDFAELGEAVAERPLAILLDELGHLTEEVGRLFLPSLHHLAQSHPHTVRVIACLPVPLYRAAHEFGLRNPKHWLDWHSVAIGPLDGDGVRALLGHLPSPARDEALRRRHDITRRTGGRPQLIQTLCYDLVDAVLSGARHAELGAFIDAFEFTP